MQTLPYVVVTNPNISYVYELYYRAFERYRRLPEVKTVEDKPRIAMEDARPGAEGADAMDQSILAPQEVYAPGKDSKASKTEVLRKGGATVSREEMSREEDTGAGCKMPSSRAEPLGRGQESEQGGEQRGRPGIPTQVVS